MISFSKISELDFRKKIISIVLISLISFTAYTTHGKKSTELSAISVNAENYDINAQYFEGYNMYILESEEHTDCKILMTDLDNKVVLEKVIPDNVVIADILFYNTTTVLFGDSFCTKMWNFETDVIVDMGFVGHHDIDVNYVDNTFLTLDYYQIEIENNTYFYDNITEYDSSGVQIRSIDTRNYVEPWQLCPYLQIGYNPIDITHANSVFFDEEERVIYLNVRNINTFYKIDYNTEELIWALGEYGNFTMYDVYGNEKENLFFHPHSLEKIDDNKFLLFDNDYHNQTDALNQKARYVEITIDENSMTANVTREWTAPEEYYSPIYGDCDLLPNNNLMGVFGYITNGSIEIGSKIAEVNEEGEIVWLLESPTNEGYLFEIYRAERFRFTPIVSAPEFSISGNESQFKWNIWNNFKSRTTFSGEYYIILDNQLMERGNITFPRYWKTAEVEYTIEGLSSGKHEISLIVCDEGGHFSNESEFYTGGFEFRINYSLGFILGISFGVGVPVIATASVLGVKNFRKKS